MINRDWCISRQLWWGHRIPAYNLMGINEGSKWIAAKNIESAKKIACSKYNLKESEVFLQQGCLIRKRKIQ